MIKILNILNQPENKISHYRIYYLDINNFIKLVLKKYSLLSN